VWITDTVQEWWAMDGYVHVHEQHNINNNSSLQSERLKLVLTRCAHGDSICSTLWQLKN
jgi:hypothetical protein